MNCKPGDLAVIVRSLGGNEWALGRIIRVTTLDPEDGVWNLEAPFFHPNGRWRFTRIEDYCLKPLSDPGDDAVDESKAWLPPIPTKEKEHA